jgi:putative tricarboxylic transport membrane protein
MAKGDRVFALISIGISAWLILESSRYNYMVKYTPGPGFMPFWVGVILLLFAFALLMESFQKKGQKKAPCLPGRQALYRVGLIALTTAGLSLLMTTLGFTLSVILFVSVILYFLEKVALVRSLITGLIMSVCIYLIFEYWMEIGLPPGLWGF